MQRIPVRLVSGSQLTTSAATYYTAPTGKKTTISSATATNTTASVATLTLYLVPSGGTAGATNTIVSARNIAPGESWVISPSIGQTLEAGGSIQALSGSATAITLVVSGYETVV